VLKRHELLRGGAPAPRAIWSATPRAPAALQALQVAGVPSEDMTDCYYAVKTGMFARNGLDVTLEASSSGAAATAAVVSGTYPIGKSSLLALMNAHLQGIPLVAVAPAILNEPQNPRSLLQIAPDSPYKTGADLNGKTIGVPALGDATTVAIRAWVAETGGDWHSLKFVEFPNAALEAAIVGHRVDAAILQTPQLDISLEAGTTKTLSYANEAIAPRFILAGYVALADWANHHADTVRTFASTLAAATSYVNTHRPETAPVVAEFTKATLANVAKMHRTTNPTVLDPALIQPLIDAAAKYGILARAFPAREIIWSGAK
jgi:NitT/TauT family transport system substrate-binding protein